MKNVWTVFMRELKGYFATPVAYVFLIVFLVLCGALTWYLGQFYQREQADLQPFFGFHPWIYLIFIPALSMRLWAEERKSGTIELLMTLPIGLPAAVVGKFLAAWAFTGLALLLTIPMWFTVNYLGSPDNGVILATYFGSMLLAGGFLAIGSFLSAITKNQVIAFVLSVVVSLLFILAGLPAVLNFFRGWAPEPIVDAVRSFSFLTHFTAISKGVIDAKDIVFFASLIGCFLFANTLVIDLKKAD